MHRGDAPTAPVGDDGVDDVMNLARRTACQLSTANGALLDEVMADAAWRTRSSFASLDEPNPLFLGRVQQSWPLFLSTQKERELADLSRRITGLIRGIPARFFANDLHRMRDFYGAQAGLSPETVLAHADLAGITARHDLVLADDGWKLIETNVGGNLGGSWYNELISNRLLDVPIVAQLAKSRAIPTRVTDTLRLALEHVVNHTLSWVPDGTSRTCNVAAILPTTDPADVIALAEMFMDGVFQDVAHRCGVSAGRFRLCAADALDVSNVGMMLDGERIHGVVELFPHEFGVDEIAHLRDHRVALFTGPTSTLGDKRNLALLSSAAELDPSGEDAELIRRHVPRTYLAEPAFAIVDGRRVDLPAHVAASRERYVLKPAAGAQGVDVVVGAHTSDAAWRSACDAAFSSGGFVAQERVRGVPMVFQDATGAALHDVVWGSFVFGATHGGVFLRMKPVGGDGVVNTATGATVGVVIGTDA